MPWGQERLSSIASAPASSHAFAKMQDKTF